MWVPELVALFLFQIHHNQHKSCSTELPLHFLAQVTLTIMTHCDSPEHARDVTITWKKIHPKSILTVRVLHVLPKKGCRPGFWFCTNSMFVSELPLQKMLYPACLRAGPGLPYHKNLLGWCNFAFTQALLFNNLVLAPKFKLKHTFGSCQHAFCQCEKPRTLEKKAEGKSIKQ